jgi:hypothetical protein
MFGAMKEANRVGIFTPRRQQSQLPKRCAFILELNDG